MIKLPEILLLDFLKENHKELYDKIKDKNKLIYRGETSAGHGFVVLIDGENYYFNILNLLGFIYSKIK